MAILEIIMKDAIDVGSKVSTVRVRGMCPGVSKHSSK